MGEKAVQRRTCFYGQKRRGCATKDRICGLYPMVLWGNVKRENCKERINEIRETTFQLRVKTYSHLYESIDKGMLRTFSGSSCFLSGID